MVTGTRSAKLQANWESGQRIRGARREVFRTFFLVPVKPFKRFCGIKIHARDLHRQAPQDGGQEDTQKLNPPSSKTRSGGREQKNITQGCLGEATTCGQPCHGTQKPRPGYQTFPILSLVKDEDAPAGPALQAKKGRNKAVVRDGGRCCRKSQTSSLPRLRDTRLPSRIIQTEPLRTYLTAAW